MATNQRNIFSGNPSLDNGTPAATRTDGGADVLAERGLPNIPFGDQESTTVAGMAKADAGRNRHPDSVAYQQSRAKAYSVDRAGATGLGIGGGR
jgi:hypothetical protein